MDALKASSIRFFSSVGWIDSYAPCYCALTKKGVILRIIESKTLLAVLVFPLQFRYFEILVLIDNINLKKKKTAHKSEMEK